MRLRDYLKLARKRGWIIVLVALVAAVSAYGFSKVQIPVYQARIRLSVNPARADWGLSNTVKDLLRNYAVNIRTHKMAQEVIDRAQLDMTTDDLLRKLFVSSEPSTFTLQIVARDRDPVVAKQIAQTMAEVFVEDRDSWNQKQDKRDRIEVKILDDVRYAEIFSPKTKVNTLAGALFGALLGGLIVFFLEWLESDIVRTVEDVERLIGVTVLGTIPAMSEANPLGTVKGRRRWSLLFHSGPSLGTILVFIAGLLVGAGIASLALRLL